MAQQVPRVPALLRARPPRTSTMGAPRARRVTGPVPRGKGGGTAGGRSSWARARGSWRGGSPAERPAAVPFPLAGMRRSSAPRGALERNGLRPCLFAVPLRAPATSRSSARTAVFALAASGASAEELGPEVPARSCFVPLAARSCFATSVRRAVTREAGGTGEPAASAAFLPSSATHSPGASAPRPSQVPVGHSLPSGSPRAARCWTLAK